MFGEGLGVNEKGRTLEEDELSVARRLLEEAEKSGLLVKLQTQPLEAHEFGACSGMGAIVLAGAEEAAESLRRALNECG